MKRLLILSLLFWMATGCAQVNQANVDMMVEAIKALDARVAANVDDPELQFAWTTRTAVSVKLDGVNAQSTGTGIGDDK